MKIIAIANEPNELEQLINDYFDEVGHELILLKRHIRGKVKLEYIIENKRFEQDRMIIINRDYSVIFRKGKFYFYKNEERDKKGFK